MRELPTPPLLVVTDRRQVEGGSLALGSVADAVFASGVRWISLREKDLPCDEQIALAVDLKQRAMAFGAFVSVHGSPEIAQRAGADGVHLPETRNAAEARYFLGERALIGQSAHTIEQVIAADPRNVNYLIVGPAFPTISKPGYGPMLGAEGLRALVQVSRVPIVAIGGIDAETAQIALNTGIAGVAVMGGAMRARSRKAFLYSILQQFPLSENGTNL